MRNFVLLACLLGLASGAKAAPRSLIQVRTSAAGPIVLKSRTAEFRITRAGYIQAFLARSGKAYGYDDPEGYAIEKDGKMYYAFFATAQPQWKGEIELRGLTAGQYRVVNYADSRDLGTVDARNPRLSVEFKDNLLLEVTNKM